MHQKVRSVIIVGLVLAMLLSMSGFAVNVADNAQNAQMTDNAEDIDENEGSEDGEDAHDSTKTPAGSFSCYTYDPQGNEIYGYNAEDKVWYLFVPSTQSLTDIELYFTGRVSESSAGTLDADTASISGAFEESGDTVTLTQADGTVTTVTVMQSNLPSVYIDLEGTTLDEIHADKEEKHKGNSVYIMDPNGNYDLTVEDSVEMKGRGNSTWDLYEKKGYQIKFDSKTSVLGMGKAKKWVLLANASDDSMMRTKLVYNTAENMDMPFVCDMEYVDLWIEGEYRGTYMLGEKVEPGSNRLDLEEDTGAIFEHDDAFYLGEDYWFYSKMLDRPFVLKEIVEEENEYIQTTMVDFEAAVDELAEYLYSTPSREVTLEELSEMIDVDSFAKYYLIAEYALNCEAYSSSFYWYKDGADDVLHLGPIWDFDTCMGNDGEPYTASYGDRHVLFRSLLAAPAFYERTQELLEVYGDELKSMTEYADVLKAEIETSAEMNYLRWDVLGMANPKGGTDFAPTFDEAVSTVKNWLTGREDSFQIAECSIVTGTVSKDCTEMKIYLPDAGEYKDVSFAVWSRENDQDDLVWYAAQQDPNGAWYYTVDLSNHNTAGLYDIHAYAEKNKTMIAVGQVYVDTLPNPQEPLTANVSEDGNTLTITATDADDALSDVVLIVWPYNAPACILQLGAEANCDGTWTANVPLCWFGSNCAGDFMISAYDKNVNSKNLLGSITFEVAEAAAHIYSDDTDSDCDVCGRVRENLVKSAPVLRMYNPYSGEHFYTCSEEECINLVNIGWNYEGVAWNAPITGGDPVYRVYNPYSGDHHYTVNQDEVDMLVKVGWNDEGTAWRSASDSGEAWSDAAALYRLWNKYADLGSHHYTASEEERDMLENAGWILEGIGWYGTLN